MADATRDHRLIAAARVTGTAVYTQAGERVGVIRDLMIDKASGRIAYAVLSFGGVLGLGERHHPLPWETLVYDPTAQGYVLHLDRAVLQSAPALTEEGYAELQDPSWEEKLRGYYQSATA